MNLKLLYETSVISVNKERRGKKGITTFDVVDVKPFDAGFLEHFDKINILFDYKGSKRCYHLTVIIHY